MPSRNSLSGVITKRREMYGESSLLYGEILAEGATPNCPLNMDAIVRPDKREDENFLTNDTVD